MPSGIGETHNTTASYNSGFDSLSRSVFNNDVFWDDGTRTCWWSTMSRRVHRRKQPISDFVMLMTKELLAMDLFAQKLFDNTGQQACLSGWVLETTDTTSHSIHPLMMILTQKFRPTVIKTRVYCVIFKAKNTSYGMIVAN